MDGQNTDGAAAPDSGAAAGTGPGVPTEQSQADFMPPPPPEGFLRRAQKAASSIPKTLLDPETFQAVVNRVVNLRKVETQEFLQSPKSLEPLKQVERYRNAYPCSARWDDMLGTDKYRLCMECRLYMYDFKNSDQDEAEKLVFKREAIQVKDFYRRKDGKFLIRDCPIGVKRAHTMIAAMVCGVLLIVGALVSLIITVSHAPPKASASGEAAPEDLEQSKISKSGKAGGSIDSAASTASAKGPSPGFPMSPSGHYVKVPIEMLGDNLSPTVTTRGADTNGIKTQYVTVPLEMLTGDR